MRNIIHRTMNSARENINVEFHQNRFNGVRIVYVTLQTNSARPRVGIAL